MIREEEAAQIDALATVQEFEKLRVVFADESRGFWIEAVTPRVRGTAALGRLRSHNERRARRELLEAFQKRQTPMAPTPVRGVPAIGGAR